MGIRFAFISKEARAAAMKRVDLYVQLPKTAVLPAGTGTEVKDYKYPYGEKHKHTAYFFDLFQSIRWFGRHERFAYLFGDINSEAPYPAFVKTRPIIAPGATSNSVVCRLNRLRHFFFVDDKMPWSEKKDMLVFRNVVKKQPHRTLFISKARLSDKCDAGQVNPDPNHPDFQRPYLSISEQLKFKFIACIEGNDVATNLKWVMSSNSIAVMPKPKIESWFLESSLIPDYHYILIADDYSDLDQKLAYYLDHPIEAQAIIDHAHAYVRQFGNVTVEKWVQYNVAKRYFDVVK